MYKRSYFQIIKDDIAELKRQGLWKEEVINGLMAMGIIFLFFTVMALLALHALPDYTH